MSSDLHIRLENSDTVTLSMHGYGKIDILCSGKDGEDSFPRLTASEAEKIGKILIWWSLEQQDDLRSSPPMPPGGITQN